MMTIFLKERPPKTTAVEIYPLKNRVGRHGEQQEGTTWRGVMGDSGDCSPCAGAASPQGFSGGGFP